MTFEQAVAYVSSLEGRGWRMGLDRMRELAHRAGLDDAIGETPGSPRFLHVAGTNGKGSVTAYVQSILKEAGYRVGGYFSPYVYDVRERIQLDARPIRRATFASLVRTLAPAAESFEGSELGLVTEFEFKTAMGLLAWKRAKCNFVALEVGMGGRLDATNIVNPACSVIVSIGLDHTEYLGTTFAEIAREKAGIIKAGRPVVAGQLPEDALDAVRTAARAAGSSLWEMGREVRVHGTWENLGLETPIRNLANLRCGIRGAHQPQNLAIAVAALDAVGIDVGAEAVRNGAAKTWLPGRFEVRRFGGRTVVLDGAHNREAGRALAESLRGAFPGRRAVLLTGMLTGHDPAPFFRELADVARSAHVAPIAFHRAMPPRELAQYLEAAGTAAEPHETADCALEAALADCKGTDLLLVAGSFYLVGEIGNLMRRRT